MTLDQFTPETESQIEQMIKAHVAQFGCILLRNNNGAAEFINSKTKQRTFVRFGLGNESKKKQEIFKSSDEIGITTIIITPNMVGQRVGVFTAIECKEPGWTYNPKDKREVAQKNFIDWVNHAGGYAGFAQSLDDAQKIIGR